METKYNFYGCLTIVGLLVVLFLGGVYLFDRAMTNLADYGKEQQAVEKYRIETVEKDKLYADTTVSVARLGAQRDITVGCMQYSWVTSSPVCMLMGGVNGFTWARWGLLGVALVCGFLWYRGRK